MDVGSLFESHQRLAAWVQGVGSLVGLGIAIWIPQKLAKQSEERIQVEARRKAMALALVIRPLFMTMKWPLERILDHWPSNGEFPLLIEHTSEWGSHTKEIFDEFEISASLVALYPKLHELDWLGDIAIPACARAERVKVLLSTLEAIWHSGGGDGSTEYESQLQEAISECLALINRTISAIDEGRP